MTTAIDSNILIDLIGASTSFTHDSVAALDEARLRGALTICPVVAAEISAYFPTVQTLQRTLLKMQIVWVDFTLEDVHLAGLTFVQYRKRSSKPKDRMLADFLVGAQALHHANALLTRDRGYYRTFFPKLSIIEP